MYFKVVFPGNGAIFYNIQTYFVIKIWTIVSSLITQLRVGVNPTGKRLK